MDIDLVPSQPISFDPDTSILINEPGNIGNDPILISESTPMKVNKKRKIAADQQKVETEEESHEKSKLQWLPH